MAEGAMPSKSTGNVAQLADQRIQSAESAMPRKSTGSVAQLAEQRTQSAESSTKAADSLMDFIRALGYVPPEHGEHDKKAQQIRRFRKSGTFTEAQIEGIRALEERKRKEIASPPRHMHRQIHWTHLQKKPQTA